MKHPSEWSSVEDMEEFLRECPEEGKKKLLEGIGLLTLHNFTASFGGQLDRMVSAPEAVRLIKYHLDTAYSETRAKKTIKHDFGTGEIFGA